MGQRKVEMGGEKFDEENKGGFIVEFVSIRFDFCLISTICTWVSEDADGQVHSLF